MPAIHIPPPIDALVATINAGDTERLLGFFTPDAVVDDWGDEYVGLDAIRTWNDRELIGAKGVMTVRSAQAHGDKIAVVADWASNFFTGPGRFEFTLAGGRIRRWQIREE